MSAVPEEFMRDPAKPGDASRQEQAAEDSGGTFWQWLAIGVLVGCWLAEAAWCIEHGA